MSNPVVDRARYGRSFIVSALIEIQRHLPDLRRVNAVLGVLGITILGIFLVWFPAVVLRVPVPDGLLAGVAVNALWQTAALVIMPYAWAVRRLGMSLPELGLSTRGLGRSTLLGCGLYAIAFAAFVHCSDGSLMQNHALRRVGTGDAVVLVMLMGVVAAGTDLLSRGFILLSLTRYSHVVFAIAVQNLVWFLGHVHEIELLVDCLGTASAVMLTLTLGVLGDVVVLRTRNVAGLAVAHVALNITLAVYMRVFL